MNTSFFSQCPPLAALVVAVAICATGMSALAAELDPRVENHPGYLSSVENERYQVAKEVVIIPPREDDGPSLRDRIFDRKLTVEFQRKYEDKFGQTQAEQVVAIPSRYFERELEPGVYVTEEEEAQKQREFGNYMTKRLAEYHIDHYLRENPSARPVYELKERVSNVDVKVKGGYKFKFRYSLSSNELGVNVQNPYKLDNRLLVDVGSADMRLFLGYPATKTIRLRSDYAMDADSWTLSGVKRLSGHWSTSLSGNTNPEGEKVVIGLAWRD